MLVNYFCLHTKVNAFYYFNLNFYLKKRIRSIFYLDNILSIPRVIGNKYWLILFSFENRSNHLKQKKILLWIISAFNLFISFENYLLLLRFCYSIYLQFISYHLSYLHYNWSLCSHIWTHIYIWGEENEERERIKKERKVVLFSYNSTKENNSTILNVYSQLNDMKKKEEEEINSYRVLYYNSNPLVNEWYFLTCIIIVH